MSDIDLAVESADTDATTDTGVLGGASAQAADANLADSLSDPLADGDDGDSVQMFAGDWEGNPSLRALKQDIAYLSEEDQSDCLDAVMRVQLARFRYRDGDPGTPQRLGFMIDDLPADSPAVAPDGRHVNLYGFTSMAVAALQSQQRELDALRAEVAALSARLAKIQG